MNGQTAICQQSGTICPLCKGLCPLKNRVGWNCRFLSSEFILNFSKIFDAAGTTVMQRHTENTYRDYPTSKIFNFFARFGNFNAYDYLPHRKEMPILLKIIGVFTANAFGIFLYFFWLFDIAEFAAGAKIFLTSVGVLLYGGLKIYEKYLDIQDRKRKTKDDEVQKNKHHY